MNLALYHRRPARYFCGDTFIRPQCHAVFDPATIPGLVVWLKADAITGVSDGASLTIWPDSSSLANNAAQSTAANKPTYRTNIINGKPVVRFDGADDFMTIDGNLTSIDIFAVIKFVNATNSGVVLGNNPASATVFNRGGGNISVADEFNTIQAVNNSTAFQLLSAQHDTAGYLRINGTQVAAGALTAFLQTPTYIGSDADTLQNLNGDLAELLIYDTVLSTSELGTIESYLNQKYAIF